MHSLTATVSYLELLMPTYANPQTLTCWSALNLSSHGFLNQTLKNHRTLPKLPSYLTNLKQTWENKRTSDFAQGIWTEVFFFRKNNRIRIHGNYRGLFCFQVLVFKNNIARHKCFVTYTHIVDNYGLVQKRNCFYMFCVAYACTFDNIWSPT